MTSLTDTNTPACEKPVSLLHVAGEGGGYVIEGLRQDGHWRFRRRPQQSTQFFGDDDVQLGDSPWVDSFEDALGQINSGWPVLSPQLVHPEFSSLVWQLVMRFHEAEPLRATRVQDWLDACSKVNR